MNKAIRVFRADDAGTISLELGCTLMFFGVLAFTLFGPATDLMAGLVELPFRHLAESGLLFVDRELQPARDLAQSYLLFVDRELQPARDLAQFLQGLFDELRRTRSW